MDLSNNRWVIHRIGLLNFWYYDEEEFHFSDGRLLLRGANGSGKSVTMQSFIPLLLDGNKSADRLDPFGSRARKLENYLLGEDETNKEESTAYLYMEFCKEQSGNYLTIGMGLRARRGKPLDFWGFSITDGRRIGRDFWLYKETGEKIPLSKIELRNRIGDGGELYEGQKEYMSMVNRLLFGFDSIEDYDELIKLLIQIRTPKLSKDFKPTVIYEIMNNSLQPLSDEDLRPMSEAIENMDNIKSQLEVLKECKAAADRLKNEYDRYNRFVLLEKAHDYAKSQEELDTAKRDLETLEADRDEFHRLYMQYEQEQESLKLTQKSYEHKRRQLEQHDSFKARQEITQLEASLKDFDARKQSKEKSLDGKKRKENELRVELKNLLGRQEEQKAVVEHLLEEMEEVAERICFYEHAFNQAELQKELAKEFDFRLLRDEIDRYREKISQAKKALEKERAQSLVYDRALEELETARREREDARRELERTETVLTEAREEFIEKVYAWEKGNELLKLPGEALTRISRAVLAYGRDNSYNDILNEVYHSHREIDTGYLQRIVEEEAVRAEYNKQLEQKQAELAEWKSRREPEPPADDKVMAARQRLSRDGIPWVPLYKAVDFHEDVPELIRGRIEEALMDMGLLNALIVPKQYREKLLSMDEDMGDSFIVPNPQFYAYELSSLLKPVAPENGSISAEEIDDVLKSIMLDKQDGLAYLNESGEYSIGILSGKTTSRHIPKYIGAEARKRHKLETINRLEQDIRELKSCVEQTDIKIQELLNKQKQLNAERDRFPDLRDLDTAVAMVQSAEAALVAKTKECDSKEALAEKAHKVLKELQELVQEHTRKMYLPVRLEAYAEAEEDANQYRVLLGALETQHVKLIQLYRDADGIERQIEDVLGDMDDLLYDLNKLNWDIQDARAKKQNYEDLLRELNYEEIQKEVDECIRILSTIPQSIEDAVRNAQTYKEKYGTILERIERKKADAEYLALRNTCLMDGFWQEYSLSYVVNYDASQMEGASAKEQNALKFARKICQDLKGIEKEGKSREDYAAVLMERYHQYRQYFAEYNLIIEYLFEQAPTFEDERLNKVVANRKRLELSARIQGRNVNFYSLVEFLEDSIEENEKLLRESDRQLFEDILANTVGKKIRARIYHSEQWVKKMNLLMESMNTSSGLSFSLVWKNRTAETEEQLDTRELVEILKSDAGLLREEDMEKLAAHFRSKIAQARKELEEKGASQTFHAIMKEVLDYRKWFEFQLFYRKTGEPRKELTNTAFYKFSGGEKAMSMYVPLFSAVYARYEGARKDCPRIISLDEAFAGVDENNIRDMFRLLEELRLNYIINSQILWGDYDTVPSLSICELIRPNNADFVTVIRYRWNGKVRELLLNEDEDTPAVEEAATGLSQ